MHLPRVKILPQEQTEDRRNEDGTTQVVREVVPQVEPQAAEPVPAPRRRTSKAKREQNFRFILAAALAGRVYHGFPLNDPNMNVTQLLNDMGLESVLEIFEHLATARDETQKDYWMEQILDWLNKEAVAAM